MWGVISNLAESSSAGEVEGQERLRGGKENNLKALRIDNALSFYCQKEQRNEANI